MKKAKLILGGLAVLSMILLASGCSVVAPRVAAAQEQARMTAAIERQADALERIAKALESAQPLLLPQAKPQDQKNLYGVTIEPL